MQNKLSDNVLVVPKKLITDKELGVYERAVYLEMCTRPEAKKIVVKDLAKKFDCSPEKLEKAVDTLRVLGWIETQPDLVLHAAKNPNRVQSKQVQKTLNLNVKQQVKQYDTLVQRTAHECIRYFEDHLVPKDKALEGWYKTINALIHLDKIPPETSVY